MGENTVFNIAIKTIEKYNLIEKGDRILVGVSGGSDSMCLLDILLNIKTKYSLSLFVVHINHLLRETDSDQDEKFVKRYCNKIGIEFYSHKVDVKKFCKENGLSIEEGARKVRYDIFRRFVMDGKVNKIAVAHNKNDQVETTLMRIMRGTGLEGITGMDFKNNFIIRPLLDITKEKIDRYCNEKGINNTIDKTNLEEIYLRNKIRLRLIPYLEKEFNVDIIDRIHKMTGLLKEDKIILNAYMQSIYEKLFLSKDEKKIVIDLNKLNDYSDEIIKRILRLMILNFKGNIIGIEIKHINEVLLMVRKRFTGKTIDLPGKLVIKVSYKFLQIFYKEENETIGFHKEVAIPGKIHISALKLDFEFNIIDITKYSNLEPPKNQKKLIQYFDYAKFNSEVILRNRQNGDYIFPYGFFGKKKLKDYFIDNKIPREKRDEIPLIVIGSEVIWIVGYRISSNFCVSNKTKKILQITVSNQ